MSPWIYIYIQDLSLLFPTAKHYSEYKSPMGEAPWSRFVAEADNKPQGLGILRDRLNLGYEASTDERKRHRALHILKPGPDLSGDYTCSVSTVQNEDMRTKTMLVYGELSCNLSAFVLYENIFVLGIKSGFVRNCWVMTLTEAWNWNTRNFKYNLFNITSSLLIYINKR